GHWLRCGDGNSSRARTPCSGRRTAGVSASRCGTYARESLLDPASGTSLRHAVVDRQPCEPARLQAVSEPGLAGNTDVSRLCLGSVRKGLLTVKKGHVLLFLS